MRAEPRVAGILLTGGASRRMGRPKATLRIQGETLADRAATLLGEVCEIALEVGPGYSSLPAVREDPPFSGPLAALAAGAAELGRLGWDASALVLAVDMPFVSLELLRYLAGYGSDDICAVPVAGGNPQPLCARYSPGALTAARLLAADGGRSMMSFLDTVAASWITEPEWGKVAGIHPFADLDDENDLKLTDERLAESENGDAPRRGTSRAEVIKIEGTNVRRRTDVLAAEEPMEIRASGPGQEPVSVAITMRTPGHDFELAAGFLYSEGLICDNDILEVKYCEIPRDEQQYNVVTVKLAAPFRKIKIQRNFYANSSCGVCGKASLDQLRVHCPAVSSRTVFSRTALENMPKELSSRQRIFDKTGGLHAAGLFDSQAKLLVLREDVGRHNACDKVIGNSTLAGNLPAVDCALFVSGRLSFEIVQKAAIAGIPLVAAVSAPSSLAVQAAAELGITLAGFVRGDRFNLYTHPERIDLGPGQPTGPA